MTRLTIRVDLGPEAGFGPGKARLLELIDETGSIRRAAAAMEMSYRQAWLLVQAVEEAFGGPVVSTARGGSGGGGASLTDRGLAVLSRYRAVERKAAKAVGAELEALAAMAAAPGRQKRRSLRRKTGR